MYLRARCRRRSPGARPWALLLLTVLLPACGGGETRSVPFVSGTVDAFEDGDQVNELGNAWDIIAEGPGTFGEVYVPPGGYGASSYALVFDGVRPEGAASSQVVGVRSSLLETPAAADPVREQLAADVSAYTGLALAIKGTPGTYIVQLGSALVRDFDYYNSYVEVGADWSEFQIPFTEFRQEGFGRRVPWNSEAASHVAVYANQTGAIRFSIDNVRFY